MYCIWSRQQTRVFVYLVSVFTQVWRVYCGLWPYCSTMCNGHVHSHRKRESHNFVYSFWSLYRSCIKPFESEVFCTFQFHAVLGKIAKIIGCRPSWGWRPPVSEIKNLPLHLLLLVEIYLIDPLHWAKTNFKGTSEINKIYNFIQWNFLLLLLARAKSFLKFALSNSVSCHVNEPYTRTRVPASLTLYVHCASHRTNTERKSAL